MREEKSIVGCGKIGKSDGRLKTTKDKKKLKTASELIGFISGGFTSSFNGIPKRIKVIDFDMI
jgi:hypothetical protein